MEYLYEKLRDYAGTDYYPFHMPGHKRNISLTGANLPYELDITEIDGFDDLHHSSGILKEAEERAALEFHAQETHYLINGSTCGILSAVSGCTERRGKILVARNCHKSVYHAVFLNELYPIYIYPKPGKDPEINGEITADEVERLLEANPGVQAVVLTSPSYDGVVSDVKRIVETVHRRRIPVIVDEAHGAHFGFHPYFPANSNTYGADLVIHSLHKTLPALTQSALLHINGEIVNRGKIRRYLQIFQSSSPSYILMAGLDECIRLIMQKKEHVFSPYTGLLDNTRRKLRELRHLQLLETQRYDRSKIVVSVRGTRRKSANGPEGPGESFTGKDLYYVLLDRYHLQMEMAAGSYVIGMTSPGDTKEGMERLVSALKEIDGEIMCCPERNEREVPALIPPERALTPWQTEQICSAGAQTEHVRWQDVAGEIVSEYAYLYPPGIPLIVPGERMNPETAEQIRKYREMGFSIQGTKEQEGIEVLAVG